MSFIEVKNLTHSYDAGEKSATALVDVTLSIEAGEFVAVLGANGSGKSTLAKHLNALLLPTAGKCQVAGMDTGKTAELWQIRAQVSMVLQNPDNQIVAAVVEDDVAFGPENLGVPPAEIRRRVKEALEAVDLAEFAHFAPHRLSGGQKQRLAIAGALAMETNCLVLDEPTAMLDPEGREDVLELVKRLNRERSLTVVYITHFMEEAAAAERIIVMDKGKIAAQGTPTEIFAQSSLLKRCGLEVPLAADIAAKLRRGGLKLPPGICRSEELVRELCRLR